MGPPTSIGNNIPPSPSINIKDIHHISPSSAGPSYMGYYLPEDLQDRYMDIFGDRTTSQVYTHCKRELMQAIWALLLDEKFIGTIRRFNSNASSMKHLAACDFEDLLQCALPVFEALLPGRHAKIVQDLLFNLATWHGYAKLRMHTEDTLKFFDKAIIILGQTVHKFAQMTCKYYSTTELPHKYASHGRQEATLASKQESTSIKAVPSGPKRKKFNLNTYKYHALGDYPDSIRQFGTTDSYSTHPGEQQHQHVKRGDDPCAFGFIDPDVVIWGTHLIPAFEKDLHKDWFYFYVNMDMFMQYRGGGIGHKISRRWDEFLQSDGPSMDHVEEEGDRDENEEEEDEEEDENEEEEEDRIEADEGEELDDDFLAAEGHSETLHPPNRKAKSGLSGLSSTFGNKINHYAIQMCLKTDHSTLPFSLGSSAESAMLINFLKDAIRSQVQEMDSDALQLYLKELSATEVRPALNTSVSSLTQSTEPSVVATPQTIQIPVPFISDHDEEVVTPSVHPHSAIRFLELDRLRPDVSAEACKPRARAEKIRAM
ncbi:uncharacterized protein EDB93DRAFT_1256297 [Suillus bovinus]|uniref:uncharacterized protein n=1 Tax=Suillus bovinus TaxID=48563 RepID=UPI001B86C277|nr:uncharacterized protein EDB93DRAFT_1256297 [Suillus bovinus]KAG2129235.1 hypothetical protein EDB93DRAFT_1256297 [Suillus bovinus]